jgi:D-3-phosphoglycerate dehydrogenase
MTGKILVTTRSFRQLDGAHQQILRDAGYEIVNSPFSSRANAEQLAPLMVDVDAAILGLDECNAEVISQSKKLRVISRYGIGLDSVDLKAATDAGVVVTNTPGANTLAVAEHTMALMLCLARHISFFDRQARKDQWSPLSGVELAGSTLGLVGLGRIGKEVARRAKSFNMRIIFYDPFPPAQEFTNEVNTTSCTLAELIAESDFISLHLPLTEETHHLINREMLSQMKPSAYLINTARGGLIDEDALFDSLKTEALAGAACDVFAEEPPSGNQLLQLDNFIATPHSGSATRQTTLRMGMMASQNALAVLRGERPEYVANPDVYDNGLVQE